jgi:hypothetical protein
MLSREFLIERGYCCGHGCLMCPYEPRHIKDNTKMANHCERCSKRVQHLAVTQHPTTLYTICFDCLIDMDINHQDYKKFVKKPTSKKPSL